MPESAFLDEGGVTITSSRFIVPGNTYAMSGVTSVKSRTRRPLKGPAVVAVIGFLILIGAQGSGNGSGTGMGVLLLVAAVAWAILGQRYLVILSTAAGEAEALVSRKREFIQRVIAALNEAIVQRG